MIKKYLNAFLTAWAVILFLNQAFIFGCFKPYCIMAGIPHTGVLAFLYVLFVVSADKEERKTRETEEEQETLSETAYPEAPQAPVSPEKTPEDEVEELLATVKKKVKRKKSEEEVQNQKDEEGTETQESDYLKQKGDAYERFIGKQFESKGDVVIYNGLMRGYEDDGVDIISISIQTKSIYLIQCKNWTKKPMLLKDIENIYVKLSSFELSHMSKNENAVNKYLQIKQSPETIKSVLRVNKKGFTIRKILYAGSDKVIDLAIGKKLIMTQTNIFRYEDMKIVVKGI